MSQWRKFQDRLLRGSSDNGIDFNELRTYLKRIGFAERIKGGHHVFTRDDVEEILNLQRKGHLAKAYQVKQVRDFILRYGLQEDDDA